MARPLIGITSNFSADIQGRPHCYLRAEYVDAVAAAGGLPLIIPPAGDSAEIIVQLDGMVFTGGYDLNPKHFGQPLHAKTVLIDPRRDRAESRLMAAALASGKPILAICLGCQWLNVVRGGTLLQHLPDCPELDDHGFDQHVTEHQIRLEPDSRLRKLMACEKFSVASSHHQAIDRVPPPLRAVGRADDGVVEAIEETSHRFCIGVQWHPESLSSQRRHRALFEALVGACAQDT